MEFKDILSCELKGVDGTEVVVSHVTIPPDTTLPKHWHPGEEIAYVIEGSLVLWQENESERVFTKGDACVVPWKEVHSVMTKDEAVTLIVFRVHEQGQPEYGEDWQSKSFHGCRASCEMEGVVASKPRLIVKCRFHAL